jgi:hypothetical protein
MAGILVACSGDTDPGDATSDTIDSAEVPSVVDTGTADLAVTPLPTGDAETCLWVQGGTDRVRASASGTPTGRSPQTVEVWVRTAALGSQVAVSHGLASPNKALYLGSSGGHAMMSAGGLEYVDDSFFVADGAWHHLAITFDGDRATLTVDGVRGIQAALDDLDVAEGEVVAGAAPATGGLAWVGWLDDVKIYERERTAADLAEPMTEDLRGLVLWWDFEVEGSGPGVAVPDLSGAGSNGVSGGTEGTPSFLPCR